MKLRTVERTCTNSGSRNYHTVYLDNEMVKWAGITKYQKVSMTPAVIEGTKGIFIAKSQETDLSDL